MIFRIDASALDGWVDCAAESGRIIPLPELDRPTRARVRLVIRALRLNDPVRRASRRRLVRVLQRAWKIGDLKYVNAALNQGPGQSGGPSRGSFQLLIRAFLDSKRPPTSARFDDPPKPA